MSIETPPEFRSQKNQTRQWASTFFALAAFLLMTAATVSAEAQNMMHCNARDVMTNALTKEYAELPAGMGVTSVGTVIELWQGEDGSSWTLLLTMPDGNSCIVGAGNDWIQLETARKLDVFWKSVSSETP